MAPLIQSLLLILAGAALVLLARRWRWRIASPAAREATFVVGLVGWLAALLGWSSWLQALAGNILGTALWLATLVVAARARERRAAVAQHQLLWSLAAAAELELPQTAALSAWAEDQAQPLAGSGRAAAEQLAKAGSWREVLTQHRLLLSDAGRCAVRLGDFGAGGPQLLRAAAQWESTQGFARESARTRLIHAGLILSTALAAISSLAGKYGLSLAHLADETAVGMPGALTSLIAAAADFSAWSQANPLWPLVGTWLAFVPWLLLAARWNWFSAVSSRVSFHAPQLQASLLVRLIGLARGQGRSAQDTALALTRACTDGTAGRRYQRVNAACAAGRPLWLALADARLLRPATAEAMQSAERQDQVAMRSRELALALVQREMVALRWSSILLSIGCVTALLLVALLSHLIFWLPLLKLSLPL